MGTVRWARMRNISAVPDLVIGMVSSDRSKYGDLSIVFSSASA